MENDIENHLTSINEMEADNMLKLDYDGQSLKNNEKFNSWKKIMLKKYGNDAKLFKCSYDAIYFYCTYESFRELPLYSSNCPSCNQPICYYCSRVAHNNNSFGDCCPKRRLYYKIFYDGFLFINLKESEELKFYFMLFLFPICTFFLFVSLTYNDFFCKLRRNNIKYYDNGGNNFILISKWVSGLIAFTLSIIYMVHSFHFKIFLLVISIFTKNNPIKYYLGIIRGGKDHLEWI